MVHHSPGEGCCEGPGPDCGPFRDGWRETARPSAELDLMAPGPPSLLLVIPLALPWETRTLLTSCCRHSSLMPESCIRPCGAHAIQLQIHTGTLESYRPKSTRQQERWPGAQHQWSSGLSEGCRVGRGEPGQGSRLL